MTASHFEASVRRERGVAVIDVRGDVDGFAEEAINAAYAEAINGNATTILLNFDDVGYINSTGIGLIVGLLAQAMKAHHRLLACGLSDHYQEIFRITRLTDFLDMFPDEVTAIASAVGSPAVDG